jgi:hypothetical protein
VLEAKDETPEAAALELACEPVSTPAPAVPIEQNTAPPQARREDDGLTDFERAYVEKARRRAMAELDTRRSKRRRRRGNSRTLVRFLGVTAAASALMLVMSWSARERTQEAPAQAVALPAAPADPFAASAADYAQAMTLLAEIDSRGLALLRRTAEAGSALAQYRLAKLYESGDGVEMDVIAARQWTERAAGRGNVRAMHDLGFYYARGDGAPLDDAAAFRWFRQAAEFGFADSQYTLGVLFEPGLGVTADAAVARFGFTRPASGGDAAALERVTQIQGDLTGLQIEQARARADAFQPRAPNALANE